MPQFEYNFTNTQLDLISSDDVGVYLFPQSEFDFIRISIFNSNNEFISSFDSNDSEILETLSNNGHKFIYASNLNEDGFATADSKVFVKINEFLTSFGFADDKYIIKFDFLRNVFDDTFNQSENYTYNDYQNSGLKFVVQEISSTRREIRLILRDDLETNPFNFLPNSPNSIRTDFYNSMQDNTYQFILGNLVLPDELSSNDDLDLGDMTFMALAFNDDEDASYNFEQWKAYWDSYDLSSIVPPDGDTEYTVNLLNGLKSIESFSGADINGDGIITREDYTLFNDSYYNIDIGNDYNQNGHTIGGTYSLSYPEGYDNGASYRFNYVLSSPFNGVSVPIINYRYDDISNPGYTSLVLRLSIPIPLGINVFDSTEIEINKELIDTQIQNLYFYKSPEPVFSGNGLTIDESITYNTTEDNQLYESYNDLTSSVNDFGIIHHILSESESNLKTDFTDFDKHIFFGSAKKQIESFKTKVKNIENHLNEISGTLQSHSGSVSISGDSTYVIDRRKKLFDKIDREVSNFTPYEHFLYFDGQKTTSGSAPSLGQNYIDNNYTLNNKQFRFGYSDILTSSAFNERFPLQDGFRNTYKINSDVYAGSSAAAHAGDLMWPFNNKYRVEKAPFFNYSSSLYLSFLLKTQPTASGGPFVGITSPAHINWIGSNGSSFNSTPYSAATGSWWDGNSWNLLTETDLQDFHHHLNSTQTGSKWQRITIKGKQSYWAANNTANDGTVDNVPDFSPANVNAFVEILDGNLKTGSVPQTANNEWYRNLATAVTQSGAEFKGSIMPSGEVFPIFFAQKTNTTSSFITNVTITKNNPLDVLPFGQVVSTGSLSWQNWYNGILSSASKYDETNINSLQNNLPLQYSGSVNLETFVSMMGQHFDLLRLYITNYQTLYNRGYGRTDSVPDNLLPILADTLGWNIISPFTSSLQDYFGNALNSQDEFRRSTAINDTWKKSLNNLIYVYKTKGTKDSIDALLNIYGYPNGIVELEEGGSITDEQNPSIITSKSFALPAGLGGTVGNVAYKQSEAQLYGFRFKGNDSESYDRRIHTDWFTNDASPINGVEFIYKHVSSSNGAQEILLSSGSGADGGENLWDLRVLSKGTGSYFTFRLNKSNYLTPTGSLSSTFTSMSTNFENIKKGELRNVLLTRAYNHISGTGNQLYKLYVGAQNGDKINKYYTASLSVNAADDTDTDYNANRNWIGTGSRGASVGGNLVIGRTLSGSLSEFRTWTTVISESKFKQHILNPFSVVGNNINSSRDDILYHYKFNELTDNTASLNGTIKINDSNPKKIKDYSITINEPKLFHSASSFWAQSEVTRNTLQLRLGGDNTKNSNKVTFKAIAASKVNLSPSRRSIKTKFEESSQAGRKASTKISIVRSPQRFLNNFIINHFSDADLLDKIGLPEYIYSSSYSNLDSLRKDFFDRFNLSFEVNKFIDAQSGLLNSEIIGSIDEQLPARADKEIGILFEPSIFERSKHKNNKLELSFGKPGPNNLSKEIFISSSVELYNPLATYENPPTDIIDVKNVISPSSIYDKSNDINLNATNNISLTSSYVTEKSDTILISSEISETMFYESSKDSVFSALSTITESMEYDASKNISLSALSTITESAFYNKEKNINLNPMDNVNITASHQVPKTGSINYVNTQFNKDFAVGDENWGRDEANDVHFVQSAASGSGNTWHFEKRYIFNVVGDCETIDSSTTSSVAAWRNIKQQAETDFTNPSNFGNREIRDKGKGYTYKSYIKVGSNIEGPQDGRPVGSTSYFVTSSDGDILYPANHWYKLGRSGDSLYHAFYGGTKNTGGRILQLREQEDYSKDSFYRVKVTGGNVMRVDKGKAKKKGDDTIGY